MWTDWNKVFEKLGIAKKDDNPSSNKPKFPNKISIIFECIVFVIVLSIAISMFKSLSETYKITEIPYNEFLKYVEDGKVDEISISLNSKNFTFTLKADTEDNEKEKGKEEKFFTTENVITYETSNPKYNDFKKDMLEKGITVTEIADPSKFGSYFFSIASLVIMIAIFSTFSKQVKGDDGGLFGDKKKNTSNITFNDIAGLNEVKQDLATVIEFLKSPDKYKSAGAKLPKGIMLYGPPGTGKTMLAKAVAGEAGVEFIAVVGSEFDEKFVGVGAQRIRKLFSEARKKAPCIIFIDEIDSLGGKRASNHSSSDRQSINQLLSEMDGFSAEDNIIVMAATNRLEDLDPALIRPGRFDNHFAVPLPSNTSDRRAIIDIYARNKKFDENVDLNLLAKETLGCSPSDIETILNESAIIAVKNNNGIITKESIDDAFYKQVMQGHKKKDMERKEEEIRVTAYHESGHALLGLLLGQEVTKVTIIPSTSGAGGVTFFNQEKLGMYSKDELENQIKVLYAGRCAEEILVGKNKITTGASNDITEASKIIKSIISRYGMSQYGMLNLDEIGIDKKEIVDEAKSVANKLYKDSYELLMNHKDKLDKIATELLKHETLSGEEVKIFLNL